MEQKTEIVTCDEITKEIKQPKKNTRAFNWCCTWNNPDMTCDEFFEFLKTAFGEDISYFTFQLEQGENETPHFKFYLEFNRALYFTQIQEKLPRGTHIEQRRSTRERAKKYCQKDDTRTSDKFYEYGNFGSQGKRTDIDDIIECVKDGMTDSEIMQLYPNAFFHHQKKIDSIRELIRYEQFSDVERDIKVHYITGDTGGGKTWFITQKHGYKNVHIIDNYKNPWDRYKGQDVVVFEEFHGQHVMITELLRWLDIYPVGLPCRYMDKQACYTTIYITSNEPLDKLYPNVKAEKPKTWNALMRRIHNVYYFDNPIERKKLQEGEPCENPHFEKPPQICSQTGMRILTPEEEADLPF